MGCQTVREDGTRGLQTGWDCGSLTPTTRSGAVNGCCCLPELLSMIRKVCTTPAKYQLQLPFTKCSVCFFCYKKNMTADSILCVNTADAFTKAALPHVGLPNTINTVFTTTTTAVTGLTTKILMLQRGLCARLQALLLHLRPTSSLKCGLWVLFRNNQLASISASSVQSASVGFPGPCWHSKRRTTFQ